MSNLDSFEHLDTEADELLPAVDRALRAVAGNKTYWEDKLGCAVHIAATVAVSMSDAERQALDEYHAPLAFKAEGRPAQAAPALRLTAQDVARDERNPSYRGCAALCFACKQTSDLRMCEACFKVAARMPACRACHHAWYCSPACQRAAWGAGHKGRCKALVASCKSHNLTPGAGAFLVPVCMGALLQPDRPQLCRFWLAGLVSALGAVEPRSALPLVSALLAFLWRFTFAAVPKPLRADLIAALRTARVRMYGELPSLALRIDRGESPPGWVSLPTGSAVAAAALRLLERDDVCCAWWRTREGRAARVQERVIERDLVPNSNCASDPERERAHIASTLVGQGVLTWRHEQPDLDPRTARLAIASTPRGDGLLHSAFGLLVARKTHAALLGRLEALIARLPASFAELDGEVAHNCLAGPLDPARAFDPRRVADAACAAARSDPRHLVVTDATVLWIHREEMQQRAAVAAVLLSLRNAGARALPLQPGEVVGQPQRAYAARCSAMGPDAQTLCEAARLELLRSYGGVYVRFLEGTRSQFELRAVGAPDLEL